MQIDEQQLLLSAVEFLISGGEAEAAQLLRTCGLSVKDYGHVDVVTESNWHEGFHHVFGVGLIGPRHTYEVLSDESHPLTNAVHNAFKAVLPATIHPPYISHFNVRVGGILTTVDSRLTRFQQLQGALDRGHEVDSYLGQLQPHRGVLEPDRAEQLRQAYLTWYSTTRDLIPSDLRDHFVYAYEGEPLKPRLRFYLENYAEENPNPPPTPTSALYRWQHRYAMHYQTYMREQLDLVFKARQRNMETPSSVPDALKHLIAQPFASRKYSVLTVNGIFEGAGANPAWLLKLPQHGFIQGQKVNQVWCWLDGIRLHAPEQEATIVTAVCQILMQQNMVGAAVGKQMDTLIAQMTLPTLASLPPYHGEAIDPRRLAELRQLTSPAYDLTKLIQLCEELNACMAAGHYLAVAMLTRAILDHVPPIFGLTKFSEVTSNYPGSKSFKESMGILGGSMRKIADAHLHTQIRQSEVLPTRRQVEVGHDLDVLLAEIVRVLKRP
jgi:hypothetical protein